MNPVFADQSLVRESMIQLDLRVRQSVYRYLWIKYVSAFDPRYHCAKCLVGKYSKALPYGDIQEHFQVSANLSEHASPYIYLCGVTAKYESNLHIAFRHSQGSEIHYEDERVVVQISNACSVPILPLPQSAANNLERQFHSCRNFQFGWRYLRESNFP